MITRKLIWISVALGLLSFKGEGSCTNPEPKNQPIKFIIDGNTQHQTIDNFGASDSWTFQFVGLWPQEKQAKMAEWLFSTENTSNGQPKGIGLSLWRFYIGAGSAEQGNKSGIESEWRRSQCFLLPNGTYDWNKQQGQRNFLQLAKQHGVDQFLAFTLSAPVYWTQNGLATNTGRDATFNLKEDKYDDFATFLAEVVKGMAEQHSIQFNYISPFNEPDGHWNWTGSNQEGTAATNHEIAKTVRLTGNEFQNRHINTNILVAESFDYNCMYRTHPYTKANRGYQIQSFFNPDSTNTYIGNVPNVQPLMAAHSYWTNTPLTDLRKIRMELDGHLKKNNVRFWQTELCVMSNDEEIGGGHQKDLTMKTALYIARIIHHDLVYANASAWQWWLAATTSDYKDGLIYTTPESTNMDGTFTDSKLMWALGNYSRFIRPGAKRIGVTALNTHNQEVTEGCTNPEALMVSAYQNSDGTPVVVAINYGNTNVEFEVAVNNNKISTWQPYLTNDIPNNNLAPQPSVKHGKKMNVPARSIITLVGIE